MEINTLIGMLYFVISGMFAYNFSIIFQRIKGGSTKVNRYSLFATSSLVMIFFAEALSHLGLRPEWVLIAQAYLLWTMLYIVYIKKKDGNKETE